MTVPPPKPPRLPGDPDRRCMIDRMVRVDHAGEYGAVRIYEGQLAVLGASPDAPTIRHMAEQERHHRATFERLVVENRVRPTALLPLWHVAGFALGAGTALLGREAAMACTVAVEEVIDGHYARQIAELETRRDEHPGNAELKAVCEKFREEELEHRDAGLDHGAERAPAYQALTGAVRTATRLAIWLSERV
ncbi:MAG: demethoxyubiquinone hydroxylase family protein [Rhodospirillales bacterium]|nr:demethoxyubiquinone hydroxylase family protein [Rhodospirillales bacterium]